MDVIDKILQNKRYRLLIDQLSSETLELVANDHLRALQEARKGLEQEEPKKLNDVEYLEALANAMQELATRVLEERGKK